ncbi:MAG: hypothetical protein Q9174_000396 [Haloplaca sp. 1 TL-2023]
MASKIIVSGSVEGAFPTLLAKISKLHAANSFTLAIILGDFFADPERSSEDDDANVSALLGGKLEIPLPTYFTLGRHPLPDPVIDKLEKADGELCPNLYFLGKRSTTRTSEGLRIVNLAGSLDSEITVGLSKEKYLPFHTEGDARSLRGANTTDILLTSNWPSEIRKCSKVALLDGVETPKGEQSVADLCAALRPRYHFSTSKDTFFEREPFFFPPPENEPDAKSITRFISLAPSNNPSKQKSIYAFNIDPTSAAPLTLPTGTTASPFSTTHKRQRPPTEPKSFSRFSTNQNGDYYRPYKRARRQDRHPAGPQECFFCLASPTVNTHLIASIANDTYLTTAKGPLSTSSTFASLSSPTHLLIIPLEHAPTLASISAVEDRARTYKEMHRYRHALHNFLISRCGTKMGAVTWEVSRAHVRHTHWQFLPVAADQVKKGLVEAAFKVEAENEKYPTFFRAKDVGEGVGEKGEDFFRMWIWKPNDEDVVDAQGDKSPEDREEQKVGEEKCFVLPLNEDFRFDVQFGRRVMSKLLGLEGRRDWRDCAQTDEEEVKDAQVFKEAFKSFDWALEE